ncbi:DUF2254 domain-containing protein [Asticcacaulis sp. AC466]|uniref:DUF2254 domain-containing protein n=1 Tax=Asticcacaulis sp. AC466 TaxID=1282362 RepID=UPI000422D9E1|nr:DUF2254 domain-containing protein [Asticcacaulis sp. AC466]
MITSRWVWLVIQVTRRIWVRASLFSLLAVVTALTGVIFGPYIPRDLPGRIGADAVDHILGIMAASMLSVTTFSLGTMVAAYAAAANNVTPRASRLISEDTTTQTVLSTFVGSFLFSLVSIVALSTGAYGIRGRVILFGVTLVVITLVVVTLLRWIDHLSHLGHVTETTQKVEEVTAEAIRAYKKHTNRGCHQVTPSTADVHQKPLYANQIGYVRHIDLAAIAKTAKAASTSVFITAQPGCFVDPSMPIAWVALSEGAPDDDAVCRCFTIGETRSFDQDPRFGMTVLAEIASRALSPAMNDVGTAIDVIGRAVRLLALWGEAEAQSADEIIFPDVYMAPIEDDDLFTDIFRPIARDGATAVEVGVRLQKAFLSLSQIHEGRFESSAKRHARLCEDRFRHGLIIDHDKRLISTLAKKLG